MTMKPTRSGAVFVSFAVLVIGGDTCIAATGGVVRTGQTITVEAGGDLQRALNEARGGDTVVLPAGATFTGNFILPVRQGGGTATLTSSAISELPPDRRVTPADAGKMPQIVTPNAMPALSTAQGGGGWRVEGIRFTVGPRVYVYEVIRLGELDVKRLEDIPGDLVFDRVIVQGDPAIGGKRGIFVNSRSTAILNSYLSDFKSNFQDAQTIAVCSSPGPVEITNNYMESAGYGIIFGGCEVPLGIVPSDIVFTRNHLFKPLSWKQERWIVKNSFEIKTARRVRIEGNLFENNWAGGQAGYAIVLTPRADGRTASGERHTTVTDIDFINNIVRNSDAGVNITGSDDNGIGEGADIRIVNNLFDRVGGRLFQMLHGPKRVTISHNTSLTPGSAMIMSEGTAVGFVLTNNIFAHGSYGIFGSGLGSGKAALQTNFPGAVVAGNVLIGASAQSYPPDNFYPAKAEEIRFESSQPFRLSGDSPYKGRATDSRDPGVNIEVVEAAIAGVRAGPPPPVVDPTGFSGAADKRPGTLLVPGSAFVVTGSNLSACAAESATWPFSVRLCEAEVHVNGKPVPVSWAGPQALVGQLPPDLEPGKDASVTVVRQDAASDPVNIPGSQILAVYPVMYPAGGGELQQFVFVRVAGRLNSERAIAAGETGTLYTTGIGPVSTEVQPGEFAPALHRVELYINDTPQRVLAAGMPGDASWFHTVDFELNPDTRLRPDGDWVWLNVNGVESPRMRIRLASPQN